MNVLGRHLLANLCQQFKESFSVIERCAFHTTAAIKTQHTKGPYRYVPILIPVEEVGHNPLKALKCHRTGGRGPDGRIWNHRRAGGKFDRKLRIVDNKRTDFGGETIVEKVIYIRYDPLRSAKIAAVAGGSRKRFIVATENMQPGDIITTSCDVKEESGVKLKEGDSRPLAVIPSNTMVHNIELQVGKGGIIARAAGSYARVSKQLLNECVLKMPSGKEIVVSNKCMASVGQVSNAAHNTIDIGSPNKLRWLGIRPRSGFYVAPQDAQKNNKKNKFLRKKKSYLKSQEPEQYVKFTF